MYTFLHIRYIKLNTYIDIDTCIYIYIYLKHASMYACLYGQLPLIIPALALDFPVGTFLLLWGPNPSRWSLLPVGFDSCYPPFWLMRPCDGKRRCQFCGWPCDGLPFALARDETILCRCWFEKMAVPPQTPLSGTYVWVSQKEPHQFQTSLMFPRRIVSRCDQTHCVQNACINSPSKNFSTTHSGIGTEVQRNPWWQQHTCHAQWIQPMRTEPSLEERRQQSAVSTCHSRWNGWLSQDWKCDSPHVGVLQASCSYPLSFMVHAGASKIKASVNHPMAVILWCVCVCQPVT